MDLRGRVVLVTGASSGIGREAAIKFAQKGCRIILTYNKGDKQGREVLLKCREYGEAVLSHLDVREDSSIENVVKEVIEGFGRIDILVNNAGVIRWKNFIEQTAGDIEEQINVNLTGLIKVTRAFLPHFLRQKEGVIINIASLSGKQGFEELTVYCGTKFGVRGFTQALSKELPAGVRIYCVNPGMTATRMTDYVGVDPKKVADVIVSTAEERLGKGPGDDVDVWDYVK